MAAYAQFIDALASHPGRYPVANLAGRYLADHFPDSFLLGDWLGTLALSDLEDIQGKLEQLLAGAGPDHAAEDLVSAVRLLTAAESGGDGFGDMSEHEMAARLAAWHEANLLEKLRRTHMVALPRGLALNPAVRHAPQFSATLAPALAQHFAAA
jgi:hypothetical protein